MPRKAVEPTTITAPSADILRGVREIAAFFRVHRKTVSAMVKDGLPVMPFGQGLATTRRLALEWFEKQVGG